MDICNTQSARRAILAALVLGVSACDQPPADRLLAQGANGGNSGVAGTQAPAIASAAAGPHRVNDKTLAVNVKAALMASAALNATTIDVSAKEGIVTLSGTTNTNTRRDLAGYLALRVEGVISVRNRITVIKSS